MLARIIATDLPRFPWIAQQTAMVHHILMVLVNNTAHVLTVLAKSQHQAQYGPLDLVKISHKEARKRQDNMLPRT